MTHKTVNLPIRVPDNDFCWDGLISCQHFDNYYEEKCELGIGFPLKRDNKERVMKPESCKALSSHE